MESETHNYATTATITEQTLGEKKFSDKQFFDEIRSNDNDCATFYTFLLDHWKSYVSFCYQISETPSELFIETNEAEDLLFKPLEAYLCQSMESLSVLEGLTQLDNASKICGKIFKFEEKAYFCQDCSCDITRVLCNDCFRHSKHRDHRYKILKTEGNGYCDCGDIDAWEQHAACEKHTTEFNSDNQEDSIESVINKLPSDLIDRFSKLIKCVLAYIVEVLSIHENTLECPFDFEPPPAESQSVEYVVFIHKNDTIIQDVDVDNVLRMVMQCDAQTARLYADVFKKQGRCPVKIGNRKDCELYRNLLNNRKTTHIISKVTIVNKSLASHQCYVEKLLIWLEKLGKYSKCLSCLTCKLLFSTNEDPENIPVILNLLTHNLHSWQNAREYMHLLFVNTVLMDPFWKREFAVLYALNYKRFVHSYLLNRNFTTLTTLNLTVQIFPVSSLTAALIERCNLFEVICETLLEITKLESENLKFLTFSSEKTPEYILSKLILIDLSYLLTNLPKEWNDTIRINFLKGFRVFVKLLQKLHGMNSVIRYSKNHIEYEPEWEKSYFFLSRLQKPVTLLVEWCARDQFIFTEALKIMLDLDFDDLNTTNYEIVNNQRILTYDVLQEAVTLHAHFTRFICIVLSQVYRFQFTVQEFIQKTLPVFSDELILALIEPSVRAHVLYSQVNCGIWKKNGTSLLNQAYLYHNIMFRNEFLDRDIVCLQIGAAMLNPNQYLMNLLHRYNLHDYLIDTSFEISTGIDGPDLTYLTKLSEYLLELLIHIFSERFETYISCIEPKEKLEREVLHFLCNIEPMSFSFLSTKIYRDLEHYTNDIDLTNVLNKIATVKNTSDSKNLKSIYELRPEYIEFYNPFFYHYTNNEKAQADEKAIKLKKCDQKFFIKPPNKLPKWQPWFKNIRRLLDSEVFIQIVKCVLYRVSQASNANAEGQFMKVLYLIGLALHEDFNDLNDFNNRSESDKESNFTFKFSFTEKCQKLSESLDIKVLLQKIIDMPNLLNESCKASAEWTLNYYLKLIQLKTQKCNLTSLQLEACVNDTNGPSGTKNKIDEHKQMMRLKAEKRRQKILFKFERLQQNFADNMMIDGNNNEKSTTNTSRKEEETTNVSLIRSNEVYCFGPSRNIQSLSRCGVGHERFTCILCQQEENSVEDNSPMILLCYVQNSRVLCKEKTGIKNTLNHDLIKQINQLHGINTTTCGHHMHSECWEKYINSINLHYTLINKELGEMFCPLCETISNIIVTISRDHQLVTNCYQVSQKNIEKNYRDSYEEWFQIERSKSQQKYRQASEYLTSRSDEATVGCQLHSFEDDMKIDINNNESLIVAKNVQLVNEFALNAAKLTSFKTDNKLNLYATIWSNCSYTIQNIEHLLSLENKSHFLSTTEKQSNLISSLIGQANQYIGQNKSDPTLQALNNYFIALIFQENEDEHCNLYTIDMFNLLISLNLSSANPLLTETIRFNLFKLIFQVHCIQNLVNQLFGNDIMDQENCYPESYQVDNDLLNLGQLVVLLKTIHNQEISEQLSDIELSYIQLKFKRSLIQFLRCAAIFYSNLFDLSTKKCDLVVDEFDSKDVNRNEDFKFKELIRFLGLDLNECLSTKNSSIQFLSKKMVKSMSKLQKVKLNIPLELNKFVTLPDDYLDLISICAANNNNEFLNVMCLICGEMLKKGTNEIDDRLVGACTAHTYKCCLNSGVFLKIDECKILLMQLKFSKESKLSEVTGCYVSAPYLDDYGETDQDFLKGNPLHLCKANYQRLYADWVSHAIPERIFSHNRYRINNVDMSFI